MSGIRGEQMEQGAGQTERRGGGGSERGKQGHVGQTHGKKDRHRDVQTPQIGAEQR